jgi:hypothetical protein
MMMSCTSSGVLGKPHDREEKTDHAAQDQRADGQPDRPQRAFQEIEVGEIPPEAFPVPDLHGGLLSIPRAPLRRAAGEREGPIAKQWEGEVVFRPDAILRCEAETHLTLPTLRVGPLPLPHFVGGEGFRLARRE